MIEFYPQIKFVHILCVILSGSLFTLRGLLMLMRSRYTNHVALRMLSYAIDTTLLTAALMLVTVLHQYPFVQAWLTVKVLLLVLYIVLGVLALRRGRTRRAQVTSFVAALLVYAFIISVAMAHNPWGVFTRLLT
ncbi:MAG: SirB2 family protein [Xanthomonadales bacterium]|nr:SirB2 family protein [Xanthomonadales bacterium]MCB1579158.1 SirB2 family protein [Xanthomonadales bacterium]